MVQLFGKDYTKQELLQWVGDVSQVGGVERLRIREGLQGGVEVVQVRTGTGLSFEVLLSRGMDIGRIDYRGIPLAWCSPTGPVAPCHFDPRGTGWLRSFHGGLVATCGLTTAGAPSTDAGEELGLHGRISHIPARETFVGGQWQGDDYVLRVEGKMREAVVFGENLVFHRRIETKLGENRLLIQDKVENCGFVETPHMLLYHINLGFPLLGPEAELWLPTLEVTPRDAVAARGLGEWNKLTGPQEGFQEQVYYHRLGQDSTGFTWVALVNRTLAQGLGVYVKYRPGQLSQFTQWKMLGQGTYVLGFEPANCRVEGRAKERERGTLQNLAPQEERLYELEIGLVTTPEELVWLQAQVAGCQEEKGT